MGKRITHVLRRFDANEWGGTETVVFHTSRELAGRGYEFKVLCPRISGTPDKTTVEGLPVERFAYFYPYLGLKRENRALMDRDGGPFLSFSALYKLLREKPLDLIHCHTAYRLGGIVRTAAKLRKIPYVVSIHGGVADIPKHVSERHRNYTAGTLDWGKPFGMLLGSRKVFDDASAIFCVGRREYEMMAEQHHSVRVEHVPNGVDISFFERGDGAAFRLKHGIAAEDPVILNVGRIMEQKNQAFLVEIFPALLERFPQARLVLLGAVIDPAYHDRMMRRVGELGLNERVVVVPGVSPHSRELADAYAACDVFALPSTYETFGIVVLEAWAARKAVVTSNAGGLPGFVEHEKNGLLLESNNRKQFIEAIMRLLEDDALRTRLAKAGYEKAKRHYDWSTVCDKVDAVYTELIETSKR